MNSRVSWFLCALLGAIAISPQPVFAQIIPGGDGTQVNFNGQTHDITGGTPSGDNDNLFHTFDVFGLDEGETANFVAPNITNILGRVTGGQISFIDGLIQVSGSNANLFLMNPAGIIFGQGASLNVSGDFTATTATGIGFGGDRWFNAFGDNDYTNLTGNPSQFAFDLANPRGIINLGDLVVDGGDLSLVGGLVVSVGDLAAPSGNLIVAAVPGSSLIRISQPGSLLNLEIQPPRNADGTIAAIQAAQLPDLLTGDGLENLLNQAGLDSGFISSGDVWGQNGEARDILVYAEGDLTLTDTWSTAGIGEDAGNIALQAGGTIATGNLNASSNASEGDSGRGGDIALSAGENIIVNGTIDTRSMSDLGTSQDGGNVRLSAEDGFIAIGDTITTSSSRANAGNIALFAEETIYTADLIARSLGEGNGGNIAIASDSGHIFTDNINASSQWGWGGDVALSAAGNLSTGNIITRAIAGEGGGDISLFSGDGSIATGFLNASALQGRGGDVSLRARGDIEISYLKTQGFDVGGRVHLSTDAYFRAIDYFIAADGLLASISTVGNWEGGDIAIYHGGGEEIPFIVGNAGVNGTAGAITTGEYAILPERVFEGDYQEGNITIGTNDPSANTTGIEEGEEGEAIAEEFTDNLSEELSLFAEYSEIHQEDISGEIEEQLEERFTEEFADYLGIGEVASITPEQARQKLRDIERLTGIKPALVYAFFTADEQSENAVKNSRKEEEKPLWQYPQNTRESHQNFVPQKNTRRDGDRLKLVVVTAEGGIVSQTLDFTRKQVLDVVSDYRRNVTNLRRPGAYLQPATELHQFLLAPLEPHLQARGINNLSFIMDAGLRAIPLAALYDGEQFAIEKYSLGMMPSLSLTDTSYRDLRDRSILAMGAEKFPQQNDLPAVPVELAMITETLWQGTAYLDDAFTLNNFHAARQQGDYHIVHLATHGEFKAGAPSNSYIQFWDEKLSLDRLPELKLNNPQVDLLVLSACRTALGDEQAELGFSGLAVMAGVKSAVGSLWYVNDQGTLAFMSHFYDRLQAHSTKAEALRQAQLAMLNGNIRVEGGQLITPSGGVDLPSELVGMSDRNLAHPYYWSAFTLIGTPW